MSASFCFASGGLEQAQVSQYLLTRSLRGNLRSKCLGFLLIMTFSDFRAEGQYLGIIGKIVLFRFQTSVGAIAWCRKVTMLTYSNTNSTGRNLIAM